MNNILEHFIKVIIHKIWNSDRFEDQVVKGLEEDVVPHHDDERLRNLIETALNYLDYI